MELCSCTNLSPYDCSFRCVISVQTEGKNHCLHSQWKDLVNFQEKQVGRANDLMLEGEAVLEQFPNGLNTEDNCA
jgi:hypothetical protein